MDRIFIRAKVGD